MENKIVYLKTYIMTIVVLVIMFAIAMGAVVYHYENKMQELKQMSPVQSGITIVPENEDTSVDGVKVK